MKTKKINGNKLRKFIQCVGIVGILLTSNATFADRLKDIATIQGVRPNQLVGYGLVVGLDGTGESTNTVTQQTIANMLQQMGMTVTANTIKGKNSAPVMVTASLPAYSKPGQTIDVTVSSIGEAKSLRGGTLIMTPLKGADGQVYAMAQGNLFVGGVGATSAGGGASSQINHLNAGRIPNGATVEKAVPNPLGQGDFIDLEIRDADFTTTNRVVNVVNRTFGDGVATPLDSRVVRVYAPRQYNQRIDFIAKLESLEITPDVSVPKVTINPRTGSIVMTQNVKINDCVISHGNITVSVKSDALAKTPNATAEAGGQAEVKTDKGTIAKLSSANNLNDIVKGLNALGATPQDLLAILQAMKAAGALKAELEVI